MSKLVEGAFIAKNQFRLGKVLTLRSKNMGCFDIPKGFTTDGLTVPTWLPYVGCVLLIASHWHWWLVVLAIPTMLCTALFPRFGNTLRAAILHDYLLKQGYHWLFANRCFLEVLKSDGISYWRCYTLFFAVTIYQAVTSYKPTKNKGASYD